MFVITSRSAFPGLAALSLFYNPNTLCHPKKKKNKMEVLTKKYVLENSLYIPDLQPSNKNHR
jgi:hypothetical protein